MPELINLDLLFNGQSPTFLEDLILNQEDVSKLSKVVSDENYDVSKIEVSVTLNGIEVRTETIETLFTDWLDRLHEGDEARLKVLEKEGAIERLAEEKALERLKNFIEEMSYEL